MTHDHPPPRTPSSGPGDDSIDAQQPTRPNRRWPSVPGYQIISELGQGGMGIVYKARQNGLNRLVALKMIRPGMPVTPRKLARFLTEAQAIATLQHPNIVQIFEIGELDGLPYYAMEYVPGSTLADVPPNRKMDAVAAARFLETLAYAIAAIHGQDIIHRDLKPSNILLTADGTPKITDFGLARRLSDSERLTGDGEILGTPSYMAPEQVCGDVDAIGPACDLYALGAIFYLLLTGKAPFTGESVSVLFATVNTPPEPPRVSAPDVPAVLENLCLKCLEKDPARRPADADEIIDTLQRFLRSTPQAFHETHSSRADEGGERRSVGQTLNLERKKRSATRGSKKQQRRRTRERRKAPSGRRWQVGLAVLLLVGLGVGLWLKLLPAPGVQGGKNDTRTPPLEPLVYLSALTPSDSENWDKEPPPPPDGRPPPPIRLAFEGKESPHGIFMHPPRFPEGGRSRVSYRLGGDFKRFQATVGLNHGPQRSATPVTFTVLLDGRPAWKSAAISFRGDKDVCSLDVTGVKELTLEVDCPGHPAGAHALWVEPHLTR